MFRKGEMRIRVKKFRFWVFYFDDIVGLYIGGVLGYFKEGILK